ncbi:MAG: hypothetical protein JWN67_54 [Actinomycetia bacterium]|nr:hypothetical protein [Actinomycetes bacterium]
MSGEGEERELLTFFLDEQRGIVVRKLAGLDEADAARTTTPTGMTLLGLVKHLTFVEERWFAHHLLGDPRSDNDADASFVLTPDDTVASVVAAYEAECERSRDASKATTLDAPVLVTHHELGTMSHRWILLHMIEETARHVGHLDILRELTDGATGD